MSNPISNMILIAVIILTVSIYPILNILSTYQQCTFLERFTTSKRTESANKNKEKSICLKGLTFEQLTNLIIKFY